MRHVGEAVNRPDVRVRPNIVAVAGRFLVVLRCRLPTGSHTPVPSRNVTSPKAAVTRAWLRRRVPEPECPPPDTREAERPIAVASARTRWETSTADVADGNAHAPVLRAEVPTKACPVVAWVPCVRPLRTGWQKARVGVAGCIALLAPCCVHLAVVAVEGCLAFSLRLPLVSALWLRVVVDAWWPVGRTPPVPSQAEVRVCLLYRRRCRGGRQSVSHRCPTPSRGRSGLSTCPQAPTCGLVVAFPYVIIFLFWYHFFFWSHHNGPP